MRLRVKICCIGSVEEARLAIRHGADALGLVSAMLTGPGVIPDELVREVAARVPPPVATFLLTSRTDPDAIVEQARFCRTTVLQLVDRIAPGAYPRLRRALPAVKLVQVLHITGPEVLEEAAEAGRLADALLLDSGNPKAALPELGGTGRVHDWALSRAIVEAAPVPVFLAGGLRADNVGVAVRAVQPFGVDLCTGVRTDGQLDPAKLGAFFTAVAATADAARGGHGEG